MAGKNETLPQHNLEQIVRMSTRGEIAEKGVNLMVEKAKCTVIISFGAVLLLACLITQESQVLTALVSGAVAFGLRGMAAADGDIKSFKKRHVIMGAI